MQISLYGIIAYKLVPALILFKLLTTKNRQPFSNQKLKKAPSFLARLSCSYMGMDIICRVIQFGTILLGGIINYHAPLPIDRLRLITVEKQQYIYKISNIFGMARKVIRLFRTRYLLQDLYEYYLKTTKETDILQICEHIFGVVGDFLNVVYFILDNIICLFLLGIFTNNKLLTFIDYHANFAWTICSLFYLFKNFVMIIKYKKSKGKSTFTKFFLLLECVKNWNDTLLNFSFVDMQFVTKHSLGMMGLLSAFLWSIQFM